jgi:hypothetical protein
MKKWVKVLLIAITSLIILLIVLGVAFYKRFVVYPPDHEFSSPASLQEAQQQDLEYLAMYPDYDKSFDTAEKLGLFRKHLDELSRKLPVTEATFEMEISKALAFADNAHSNISAGARARRLNGVPLRFHWFREGLYVILAREGHYSLLGKRIILLNGVSPEELLIKMKPWYGGTPEALKERSPLFFMSPQIMHAMGYGSKDNMLEIVYSSDEGKETLMEIANDTVEKDIPGYWPAYWLNPHEKIKSSSWKSCKPEDLTALPFQEMKQNVLHQLINNSLYVQINENYNTPERHLEEYLDSVSTVVSDKMLDKIILDIRFNPGGNNYHLPWPFIRFMDEKLSSDQKAYIITGNTTFSAGIITAAYAKHILGDKAVFVGEKVGDRLQYWADGGAKMTLPNSKISPRIWTAYSDWENGCNDFSKCFWITYFDGVAAGKLPLDKKIKLSFNDYINGRDSVLEAILSQ